MKNCHIVGKRFRFGSENLYDGDDECNAEATEYSCGGIYNHNYMDVVGNRNHDCFLGIVLHVIMGIK